MEDVPVSDPKILAGGKYVTWDGMCWPTPMDEPENSLEWRLRYALPEQLVKDRYNAASIVDAYRELIMCPAKKREQVIRILRKAIKQPHSASGDSNG
jgi:hypothetical protein